MNAFPGDIKVLLNFVGFKSVIRNVDICQVNGDFILHHKEIDVERRNVQIIL